MNNSALLKVVDLSFSYPGTSDLIFENINFSIFPGESISITGKSGMGKSTLLKILNRLLEHDNGVILYKGKSIKDYSPIELRKEIAYLPQTPYLIEGTVKDNLELAAKISSNRNFSSILEKVGLSEAYLNKNAAELSTGQKQRVSLARTLLNPSRILLLDEPNSALDEENSKILLDTLDLLIKEDNKAIILISHDVAFSKQLSQRFLLLKDCGLTEIPGIDSIY